MTQEEDIREVDIVYLAVVSTSRCVNHAYFDSICCEASFFFFAHYPVTLASAFTVSAPNAWMLTYVQLVYLLITGCSFIKGCLWGTDSY